MGLAAPTRLSSWDRIDLMKWRLAGSVALLAGALVGVAGAQDVQLDPLSRLDARYRFQIDALIDSARQAGLPWAAVRSKALQGVNLKFDAPKIVVVVRQFYVNLGKARSVLGPVGDTEIETGASALTAGIRLEDLALFRPTAPGRSPTRALVYLADLIPPDTGSPVTTRLPPSPSSGRMGPVIRTLTGCGTASIRTYFLG